MKKVEEKARDDMYLGPSNIDHIQGYLTTEKHHDIRKGDTFLFVMYLKEYITFEYEMSEKDSLQKTGKFGYPKIYEGLSEEIKKLIDQPQKFQTKLKKRMESTKVEDLAENAVPLVRDIKACVDLDRKDSDPESD